MNSHKTSPAGTALIASVSKVIEAQKKGHIHQPKNHSDRFSRALIATLTSCREEEKSPSILHGRGSVSFFRLGKDRMALEEVQPEAVDGHGGLLVAVSPAESRLDITANGSSKATLWSFQAVGASTVPHRAVSDIAQPTEFSKSLASTLAFTGAEFGAPQPGKFFEKANASTLLHTDMLLPDAGLYTLKILAADPHSEGNKSKVVADIISVVFSSGCYGYALPSGTNGNGKAAVHQDVSVLLGKVGLDQTLGQALAWADRSFFMDGVYSFLKQTERGANQLLLLIRKN